MFFTTRSTGSGTSANNMHYYSSTFGRENAFTLRNLRDEDYLPYEDSLERQCHEFLMIFETAQPFNIHNE